MRETVAGEAAAEGEARERSTPVETRPARTARRGVATQVDGRRVGGGEEGLGKAGRGRKAERNGMVAGLEDSGGSGELRRLSQFDTELSTWQASYSS